MCVFCVQLSDYIWFLLQTSMSVIKTVTIVILLHSVRTQWGALTASAMMDSLEMEPTVTVSVQCKTTIYGKVIFCPRTSAFFSFAATWYKHH